MPGVIPKLRWERRDNGSLALVVPASHRGLLGERPAGRIARSPASLANLELTIEEPGILPGPRQQRQGVIVPAS